MGKIRKKTSKRGTTNRRKQIQNKVRESRKKAKKEVKKNPQWKSKKPKDPGIPNNFPYKDQILAELAEERRKATEAKERRKEEKKALKARAKGHPHDEDAGEDEEVGEGPADAPEGDDGGNEFDGIATLHTSATSSQKPSKREVIGSAVDAADVPLLLNPDWPNMQAVLDDADAVIEVLDARDPLGSRLAHVERLIAGAGKKILFVLNKIDTCPREVVAAWSTLLRAEHPTVLFRSATAFIPATHDFMEHKGKGKAPMTDAWGSEATLDVLSTWAREKRDGGLKVAVIGWANAGKSSFINSLSGVEASPTYTVSSSPQAPTTTPYAVGIPLSHDSHTIMLIDTPGLSPSLSTSFATRTAESEVQRCADVLLRSRGRLDRLHDPLPALAHVVARLETTEDVMLFYNLPAFERGNADAFLAALARSQGLIGKKGVLDKAGAARVLLRDWVTGKLPRVAVPPTSADITDIDRDVLGRLRTRTEMRKGDGLVRLSPLPVDDRSVDLSTPWTAPEEDGGEGARESGEDDEDGEEDGETDEDDSNEEEDSSGKEGREDDEEGQGSTPPLLPTKRKSSRGSPRPLKKVAFDIPFKGKGASKSATEPKTKAKVKAPSSRKVGSTQPKRTANAPPKAKASDQAINDDAYSFTAYFK